MMACSTSAASEDRDHISGVFLDPVAGELRRAVTLPVPAVVHDYLARWPEDLRVAGHLPHPTVAGATGVEEERWAIASVCVIQADVISCDAQHAFPRASCRRAIDTRVECGANRRRVMARRGRPI